MRAEFDLPQGLPLALYWAGRGCRVHPVRYIPASGGHAAQKKPLERGWQKVATTDRARIEQWWARWPDAWVGMATGRPGYDVVDFDVKDNANGQQSWERLIEAGLIDSYLFEVATPSGGWHRYFPGTDQRNSQIAGAGVDFRAAGGFVMAPGNPGYEMTAIPVGDDLAAPADWAAIKALLQPEKAPPTAPAAPTPSPPPPSGMSAPPAPAGRRSNLRSPKPDHSWTREQADREIHRVRGVLAAAQVGSINIELNNAAMRIGHFVPEFIDYSQAVATLESALSLTDYDGRTWKADDTIRSGLRAGMQQPYEARPDDPPRRPPAAPSPDQQAPPGMSAPPPVVEPTSNRRETILQRASEFTVQRVRWLWADRIPAGEITLVAGREGSGKSTYLAWLARAITRGELPGEYLGRPKAVLYAAAEDSWEHTLAPRLLAAGADLDLVYRVAVRVDGVETSLVLPLDVAAVFEQGREADAAVLMLDPGLSFLDGRIDSFKSQELRPALEALRRGAERVGMSVAMLCHFNKTQGTDVLSKIAGSRAFAEVARAALAVAADDSEDDEGEPVDQVILSQVKNNLGRSNLPNLTYRIVDTAVPTSDGDAHVGRLVWVGETDRSAEQALNGVLARERKERADPDRHDPIRDWVIEQGRTVSVAEVHGAFPQMGREAVKKRLARLVGNGLYRPVTGHYAAAHLESGPDHTVPSVPSVPQGSTESSQTDTKSSGTGGDVPLSARVPVPHPPSPSSTLGSREREGDKRDGGTGATGGTRARRPGLRSPQEPDEGWLVHGDPYRG